MHFKQKIGQVFLWAQPKAALSLLIRSFSVETLANSFRQKGIAFKGKEIELSQYTDDTTLVLEGS